MYACLTLQNCIINISCKIQKSVISFFRTVLFVAVCFVMRLSHTIFKNYTICIAARNTHLIYESFFGIHFIVISLRYLSSDNINVLKYDIPSNASSPIDMRLPGNVILANFLLFLNALISIPGDF